VAKPLQIVTLLLLTAYTNLPTPYPTVPSPTLHDEPFSHNTRRYRQTDDRQTDRTSYHKRDRRPYYSVRSAKKPTQKETQNTIIYKWPDKTSGAHVDSKQHRHTRLAVAAAAAAQSISCTGDHRQPIRSVCAQLNGSVSRVTCNSLQLSVQSHKSHHTTRHACTVLSHSFHTLILRTRS